MPSYRSILFSLISLITTPVVAGQFNQVLSVGDQAPAWKDLVGVDDKPHSLGELSDREIVVVAFTCNSCPYAVDAEDRINALQRKYADRGVSVVAINVNKVEADLLPAMKERAAAKEFEFPYLFDGSQQIATEYGAKYTPEFFVLDRDRRIVYMGSLDDSPDGRAVQQRYVESAIDAALQGTKPATVETVPIGCRIRMESRRRGRRSAD